MENHGPNTAAVSIARWMGIFAHSRYQSICSYSLIYTCMVWSKRSGLPVYIFRCLSWYNNFQCAVFRYVYKTYYEIHTIYYISFILTFNDKVIMLVWDYKLFGSNFQDIHSFTYTVFASLLVVSPYRPTWNRVKYFCV